jgi:phosphogluconate dehydratase
VNQFQAAGGPAFVLRELIRSGCAYGDVPTVAGNLWAYTARPESDGDKLAWRALPASSPDESVVRLASTPFQETGGLRLLQGNLGRAVVKISAVPEERHFIEAPAVVFDTQEALMDAFKSGVLDRDFVAVFRFQGPRANGMPELHKLTPPLSVLQSKGFKVAIVTDGRMSGASGEILAAIHVSPEVLAGGPMGRIRDGDIIRVDAVNGCLQALVADKEWAQRPLAVLDETQAEANSHDLGRDLFGGFRRNVLTAEQGAVSWL